MMKEVYDWYMEHMLGIHERKSKAVSKQRQTQYDRKKNGSRGSMDISRDEIDLHDLALSFANPGNHWKYRGRSKWERIGAPMLANTFDQFLIINPFIPHKMRAAAITRQVDEWIRVFNQ